MLRHDWDHKESYLFLQNIDTYFYSSYLILLYNKMQYLSIIFKQKANVTHN